MTQQGIPCTIMRGGTSKALFFMAQDLPQEQDARDAMLLRLMGSPDARQIDGLGGAASVTSKVAIISPSARNDADIDYLFAQVSLDKPFVSYAGNCGNISSAVGPYAVENGLVKAVSPVTTVRVHNVNTDKIIEEVVQTPDGNVTYEGDYGIRGVPGTAAPVELRFLNPAGSVFDTLLPTGHAQDVLTVEGVGEISVSIVDASNPLVFVEASAVGMNGTELPVQIDADDGLLQRLEAVRGAAATMLGLCETPGDAATVTPAVPKLAVVSAPTGYTASDGSIVSGDAYDISIRMMSMQHAHPTCAMTGAMCTAAAAAVPGSLVQILSRINTRQFTLRLGHAGGIMEAGADVTEEPDGRSHIRCVSGFRTARRLMTGTAYV